MNSPLGTAFASYPLQEQILSHPGERKEDIVMNKQTIAGVVIGAAAVTAIGAFAGFQLADQGEYAKVTEVKPNMTSINIPRDECRNELVTTQKPVKDPHQVTGTIAGAIIGGVLGNQVGDGSGKDIATAAGAVAGGVAGNKIQEKVQKGNTEQTIQPVCATVYDERLEQQGYLVTYEWQGATRQVVMDHDPGRKLEVENGEVVFDQ